MGPRIHRVIVSSIVELSSATAPACGLLCQACHHSDSSNYLVTRGGGNNSATTTPITNIQIKLLLSSNLSTARLFSGENKSVAKINVLHTVLSRPAKVPNLIVTATITTKNKNGNMDFRELCRNEKLRPRASTTQSAVPSSALRVFFFCSALGYFPARRDGNDVLIYAPKGQRKYRIVGSW